MSTANEIHALFPLLPDRDPNQLAPLVLSYVGDTVYDLFVRTLLIHKSDMVAHGLHVQATKLVKASAQAAAFWKIQPLLTEEELSVYRRARNAHMGTIPKNASVSEYRTASGIEAVMGYLFLKGREARIRELMKTALEDAFTTKEEEI